VGHDLARETGLPWVADFRDPWTQRISFDPPTRLHRRRQLSLERSVVSQASALVVTAEETRRDFLDRYPTLTAERVRMIPNGFDPADFPEAPPSPRWDRFQMVFLGQLTAGRTIAPLVPVLDAFFARVPDARSVTRVRLIGPRELENDLAVQASGLTDVVRFEAPRLHRDAVRELFGAHVLLLLESMGPRGGLIAQGKLYEYLYSTRPMLAIVPSGAVSRLVGEHRAGCAAGTGEVDEAAAYLESAYTAWSGRRLLDGARRDDLDIYSREYLTRDLASLFGTCLSSGDGETSTEELGR
jgi:hypothetical protein